ncbi:ABC transporter ATP-binding protein [Desertibaculum subflavum]|uniref:ABC transporter ATP-binding protein n=1 Tax=Desertibaculum subflavum TaxID=2268458 RepID=UPI000E65F1C4
MTATVTLEGVVKRYGPVEAVRGVTFTLPAGEIVALVGHNGAGKTTLLKLMLGLIRPTSGDVRVLDENPSAGEFAARKRLGYLPENVAFNASLTGREVLAFYARLKRQPVSGIASLLDRVGLSGASGRRIGTYSKGMRQRLGLAQALLGAPRILLLDEPTTGLDPALRLTFYEIVRELRDQGATVVLCSHALTELEERAERVIIMNRGLMVANGTLDELRHLTQLPTRIRLHLAAKPTALPDWLRSMNYRRFNGHVVELDASPGKKMELLRWAAASADTVDDIDVVPPTLDELYVHFLRSQEAAP